jgi:hypothetical protein
MPIELTVSGNGKFAGHKTNLISYSANEESTPIDPSDTSGGYGQLKFNAIEDASPDGSALLLNDTVTLADGSNGSTMGVVSSVDMVDGIVTITADSRLGILRARVQAAPFNGTLASAFTYYLSLAGLTSGISVDPAIAAQAVSFPGWNGEAYLALKQMCAALEIEMALVSNNVVLRPIRTHTVQNLRDTARAWHLSNGSLAKNIEIYYYNNVLRSGYLAYPPNTYTDSPTIGPLEAGQVMTLNVELSASLSSVNQPVAVSSVDMMTTGPSSVYTVMDKENNIVDPTWWTNNGGKITVSIGQDTRSLDITVIGATDDLGISPYRIAQPGDDGEPVSTLKITGSGVFFRKELLTIPTGADAARTAQDVGTTIDSEFISTMNQAYTAGLRAAATYASAGQTIDISATVINRRNERGEVTYPTFDYFNNDVGATATFSQFSTTWAGQTFKDFAAYYLAQVVTNFENQAFGNAAGARVLYREAWYRARQATVTPDEISYSAERDTLVSDFNTVWSGKTFAQFNTRWSGKTFEDMAVIPLWV